MKEKKLNCWEFQHCGRELGGKRATEMGICSAALERRLNGIHGGVNAGRACWVVAGTFCGGKVSGSFAVKYSTCKECNFYKTVQVEDFQHFQLSMNLLRKLEKQEVLPE